TGDAQMIHCHRERGDEMRKADLHGREPQILSNLIQMDLESKARLRCAMPTLWTARWLIGKNAQALEAVMRDFVGDRLQRPSIENRGHAIAAIPTAIYKCLKMECRDGTIALHPSAHPHQHRMASSVRIKHLFTCEADFDGPSGQHRELGRTKLVGEHVAFTAKATPYRRGNHAHPTGREPQHCRQGTV